MFKVAAFHFTLILVLCIICVNGNDSIGDACYNNDYNKAGLCVLLKDCKSALADLSNRKYPQTCGFQGAIPIVCCTNNIPIPSKSERKPGDIADQKCWEYSESVYKITYTSMRKKLNVTTCTLKQIPLVVSIGGEDALNKEFPHMALLGFGSPSDKLWKCGGTLISDQFVLTAGHCLSSHEFGRVKFIRLGELNIAKNDDIADPQDFDIIERIPHPLYKSPSRYNDIALLKMDRPVKFSEFIRPACLHLTTDIPTKRYIATGWGITEVGGKVGSNHLQKVIVDSYSQAECDTSYKRYISTRTLQYGIVPESQLCAGGKEEEKDTCQGDSGGPLQIYHPQAHCMYSIVGVTSFGKSCGIVGNPGVYTRVSNYIDWIEKTVWP